VNVSVVLVTRGNVDLSPIIGQDWPDAVQEVIVWDNSAEDRRDLKVYGRYAAIKEASHELIYVQDDDCTLEAETIEKLIAGAEANPGTIIANMPEHRWFDYPDSCLVGWGAVFHRDLPWEAFQRYFEFHAADNAWLNHPLAGFREDQSAVRTHFMRTCDVVFTTLTPHVKLDLGFTHLPWAEGPDRMFKERDHKDSRDEMLALARKVRDARD
jgi:hypothetical protein